MAHPLTTSATTSFVNLKYLQTLPSVSCRAKSFLAENHWFNLQTGMKSRFKGCPQMQVCVVYSRQCWHTADTVRPRQAAGPLAASKEQLPLLVPGPGRLPKPGGHQACWHLWSLVCGHAHGCHHSGLFSHSPEPGLLSRVHGLMFCSQPKWTGLPRAHLLALETPRCIPAPSLGGKGRELRFTEHCQGTAPTDLDKIPFPHTRERRGEKH